MTVPRHIFYGGTMVLIVLTAIGAVFFLCWPQILLVWFLSLLAFVVVTAFSIVDEGW